MQIPNPDRDFWNSNPKTHFWANLGRKNQSCLFFLKIDTWHLDDADSYSGISFLDFRPQIHFWQNLGQKSQSCPIWLKIGTQSVSTMLILIPTLFFSVSNPKSFFGQIWAKKFKVVHFDWKLAHMVYRGCWFLFRQYFFELPTLNPFFGKFGLKKSKLFVLPENWHTRTYTNSIAKMLILISILVFSNFKLKSWGCWFLFWD